jgi:hypothetical protein
MDSRKPTKLDKLSGGGTPVVSISIELYFGVHLDGNCSLGRTYKTWEISWASKLDSSFGWWVEV